MKILTGIPSESTSPRVALSDWGSASGSEFTKFIVYNL